MNLVRWLSAAAFLVMFIMALLCFVRQRDWGRVVALTILSWAVHGLIYSVVLAWAFWTMNGHWARDAQLFFNNWSSALRLHGEVSAVILLAAFARWSKRNGIHAD